MRSWELMGTYGNLVHAFVGTYGNLWELMGTYGNLWELMGTYGNLWELMGTYGNLWVLSAWELMRTYGNLWELSACVRGNLWELVGTYGNLWELVGTYGNLCELIGTLCMGAHGNLWELQWKEHPLLFTLLFSTQIFTTMYKLHEKYLLIYNSPLFRNVHKLECSSKQALYCLCFILRLTKPRSIPFAVIFVVPSARRIEYILAQSPINSRMGTPFVSSLKKPSRFAFCLE